MSVDRVDVADLVATVVTVRADTGDVTLGRVRRVVRRASLLPHSVVASAEDVVRPLLPPRGEAAADDSSE